jgi:hypothetical protein
MYSLSNGGSLRISTTSTFRVSQRVPVPRGVTHRDERAVHGGASGTEGEVAGPGIVQAMAATLGFQQHREGGVLLGVDGRDRVHHDDEVLRHGSKSSLGRKEA